MEKRKERLKAVPHTTEKSLLSASENSHPLSPDVSSVEEIDNVISILEDIEIEAVDVLDEEGTIIQNHIIVHVVIQLI